MCKKTMCLCVRMSVCSYCERVHIVCEACVAYIHKKIQFNYTIVKRS